MKWTAKIPREEMALRLCDDLVKKLEILKASPAPRVDEISRGLVDGLLNNVTPHPMEGIPPVRNSMSPGYCAAFDVGATWSRIAGEWGAEEKSSGD